MNSLKLLICIAASAATIVSHPIVTISEECHGMPLLAPSDAVDVCEDPLAFQVSEKDKEALLRMAEAEATGGEVKDKALVMQVILNRVYDPDFPNTVEDVIMQKNQFSPVSDGRYYTVEPDEICEQAFEQVVCGEYMWCEALFFARKGLECWASRNREYMFTEWEHDFYK